MNLRDRLSIYGSVAMLAVASPAAAQTTNRPMKDDIVKQNWINCIGGSFTRQLNRSGDKYMAGENAVQSCKTERREWIRVLTIELGVGPADIVVNAADSIEYELKNALIRGAK